MSQAPIDEVRQTITDLILEEILWEEDYKELPKNANLLKIMDSLGITTLISHLEERYEITVTNDLLVNENLNSVDALANLVIARQGVGAANPQ
jgi:acyl carrier protein